MSLRQFALLSTAQAVMSIAACAQTIPCTIVDVDNAANNPGGAPFVAPAPPTTSSPWHNDLILGPKGLDPDRPVAPGEIIVISLSGCESVMTATDASWPTTLSGFKVLVGGKAVPIYSVGVVSNRMLPEVDTQITALIPLDLSGATYVDSAIQHITLGVVGNGVNVGLEPIVVPVAPKMYQPYLGLPIVQDAGFWFVNDEQHPLISSTVAVWGFGWGAVAKPIPAGTVDQGPDPTTAMVTADISDETGNVHHASVLYAGLQPGTVGEYLAVVQVPSPVAKGFSQMTITVGGTIAGIAQIVK